MERLSVSDVSSITSPVPSYRSTASENDRVPVWARKVAASVQNRNRMSRASSIISTTTKLSTNTAEEDAGSIDLNIDGVNFRINRDGSRITTNEFRDTLPPYIPRLQTSGESGVPNRNQQDPDGRDDQSVTTETGDRRSELNRGLLSPRDQPSSPGVFPEHISDAQIGRRRATTDNRLSRNPSFTPGDDTISVVQRRTVSQNDVPSLTSVPRKPIHPNARLRRRNGVRLPSLVTGLTDDQQYRHVGGHLSAQHSASPDYRYPRSADPTLGNDNHAFVQRSPSPMFIGRDAPGLFPSTPRMPFSGRPPPLSDDQTTMTAHSPAIHEEGYAETYPPPPMDSENDISVHYTRVLRSIDRDHRKALIEQDKEMAKLRERLHEQDTVYRQQLRGRDFIIDDLKSRIAHLETGTEATVEKACNSVEELWESRWKDRDFHLMERMRRMETDLQMAVERAIAERDKAWAKGWATKYKQLVQRLEAADQIFEHDREAFDANPAI